MADETLEPAVASAVLEATRTLDREACLSAIASGAQRLLGAAVCLAYFVDEKGEDLEFVAGAHAADRPDGAEEIDSLRLTLGLLDAGLVTQLTPDGVAELESADSLVPASEQSSVPALGRALLLPLRSSSGRVGLLLALMERNRPVASPVMQRGERFVHALIPALDNLRDVELLRELVLRDDTTDCYNRRCLDENLDAEVERTRRFGGRFAVIFLDMDNLKEVNTLHGHAAGSKVLREASVRIGGTIRSIDRLYRYGGDEFVAILPGTGAEGAREVAERIRTVLSREPFATPSGAKVSLTASTGIAVWPDHAVSGREALMAADAAMRRVKATGKDGVETAGVGEGTPPKSAKAEASPEATDAEP